MEEEEDEEEDEEDDEEEDEDEDDEACMSEEIYSGLQRLVSLLTEA